MKRIRCHICRSKKRFGTLSALNAHTRSKHPTETLLPRASRDGFYSSPEWKRTRYKVLVRDGGRCLCCGVRSEDGARLNVDHIKPRRLFPELSLVLDNLQTLCSSCNEGKGNWDSTDWRHDLDMKALAELRERGLLN